MKGLSDLLFRWFAVRQNLKYNSKIRGGQGFTLEELKVCFYVAQKVPDFLGKWILVLSPCQNLWSLLANDQLVVVPQEFSFESQGRGELFWFLIVGIFDSVVFDLSLIFL